MALSAAERLREVTSFDESKSGVKGLSDAGITSIPRIFIHPPATLSSLKSSISLSIPVIDLSGLNSPDRRVTIAGQVKSAASTWGFFQVVNHGIPETAVNGIITAVKAFHEQPRAARQEHYTRDGKRAFSYMTNLDLHRSEAASWNDHIKVVTSPNPPDPASIPEICRREVFEWDARVTEVGETLMELLCEGLGLGSRRFRELTCADGRDFIGKCYPHCPQPDLTVGMTSHTDPQVITVLVQNHVPGLQVNHGGDWVDVKPVPGGLIVNIGDLLQIISNDQYKSVQHRVLANSWLEARISAVTFFNIARCKESDETYFGPLPELVSPKNPPKYRNFTLIEYDEVFFGKPLGNMTAETFKINK